MGKHILCFDCFPAWGGGQKRLTKQVQQLLTSGYRVSLVCPSQSPFLTDMRPLGVATIGVKMGEQITNWSGKPKPAQALGDYLNLTRKLNSVLAERQPDLVYALGSRSAKSTLLAVALRRLPLCWTSGNLYPVGKLDKLLLRYSVAVICNCDIIRRQYSALTVDNRKLHLVRNSLDVSLYASADPVSFRRELGLSNEDVLVGVVGRISAAKGQLEFAEAIMPLTEEAKNLHGAIVGAPASQDQLYFSRLQNVIDDSVVPSRMHLTGWRTDIRNIMKALDILVLPSLAEPCGNVIIEGMAAGKPVVATAAGGVPEIVLDGITGLHVPPGDVPAMTQAIRRLILNPQERDQMGKMGQKRALELFDDRQVLPKFAAIISGVLNQGAKA